MKKIYSTLFFSAAALFVFAQNGRTIQTGSPVNVASKKNSTPVAMTPTDTLWGTFPLGSNTSGTATPSLWTTNGGGVGGFVAGNNGYGDLEKAQAFTVTTPYMVEGCIFWFGALRYPSANATSKVVAHLYDMTGTATLSTGSGAGPGAVITATNTDILLSSIDTTIAGAAGFVFVTFTAPYFASGNYAAGIDLTTIAATDSVGLVCTDSGNVVALDKSFDNWSGGGGWHSFLEPNNWGLDVDMAIFPIVDMSTTAAEEFFVNGIKLYQNSPNPFNSSSVITYELENNAKNVTLFIHSQDGKQVQKIALGNSASGQHTVNLSASDFASGTYYFMLQADHNRIAKKMTIAK